MSEKRRDNKGRILRNGEIQLSDGRYSYKYIDSFGETRYVYSWKLDRNDRMPAGKKAEQSLREKEKQITADIFDQIVPDGGKMTVCPDLKKWTQSSLRYVQIFPFHIIRFSHYIQLKGLLFPHRHYQLLFSFDLAHLFLCQTHFSHILYIP